MSRNIHRHRHDQHSDAIPAKAIGPRLQSANTLFPSDWPVRYVVLLSHYRSSPTQPHMAERISYMLPALTATA